MKILKFDLNLYLLVVAVACWTSRTTSADKDTFTQLTDSAFSNIQCVPYAYGDFNADKLVDIFCVSNAG
jgi:hypothetical protein